MFGAWRPRAVVFDCDGLLVDTEPSWTVAETELCRRRGVPFTDVDKRRLIGCSVPDACRLLADRFGDGTTADALAAELLALVDEVVARDARPMPGARELVAAVAARVPVAVASNSPRSMLEAALARGGLAGTFAVSVAADEVARPKPHPELYLVACARLGQRPGECLALEDSATGMRSARAAGLRTIGVPTLPGTRLGGDVTVPSLTDPELVAWVAGWPGGQE